MLLIIHLFYKNPCLVSYLKSSVLDSNFCLIWRKLLSNRSSYFSSSYFPFMQMLLICSICIWNRNRLSKPMRSNWKAMDCLGMDNMKRHCHSMNLLYNLHLTCLHPWNYVPYVTQTVPYASRSWYVMWLESVQMSSLIFWFFLIYISILSHSMYIWKLRYHTCLVYAYLLEGSPTSGLLVKQLNLFFYHMNGKFLMLPFDVRECHL